MFQSKDCGEHLLAAENLLTKHGILETQVTGIDKRLKSINRRAQQFARDTTSEGKLVKEKLDALNKEFEIIQELSLLRRQQIEQKRDFYKFTEVADEETSWLQEKLQLAMSSDLGHDLNSTMNLVHKHEQLEAEIKFRKPRCDKIVQNGQSLVSSKTLNDTESRSIGQYCKTLNGKFDGLVDAARTRRVLLEDSYTLQQFYADTDEAGSWIADKTALVNSQDFGKDEASTQALLQRHNRIEGEINAYGSDMARLDEITNVLAGQRRFSSFPADVRNKLLKNDKDDSEDPNEGEDDDHDDDQSGSYNVDHVKYDVDHEMPDEVEEEEIVEREEIETVAVEKSLPCVRASYPYESKNFGIEKNETLELKDKTNSDWWLVEKTSGQQGYVPANYVRDIGMQTMSKLMKRPIKRKEIRKVRKIVMKPKFMTTTTTSNKVMGQETKKPKTKTIKKPQILPRQLQNLDTDDLVKRQMDINHAYKQLKVAAVERKHKLEDTINLFKWQRKYDECVKWTGQIEQQMTIDRDNSLIENPDAAKRRYHAFNTDFLANQANVAELDRLGTDLVSKFTLATKNKDMVRRKQADFAVQWAKLLDLKKYWDNTVKSITCIEAFNGLYADVTELIKEKLNIMIHDDINTTDVNTVRSLQAKQDKLEREIGPIEQSVRELKKTASEVCTYFPQEKSIVSKKLQEIENLWMRLKDEVTMRKAKLDEKHGVQRFDNDAQDILTFLANMQFSIDNEFYKPHDLKECELMIKKLNELDDEYRSRVPYKHNELKVLGHKLLTKKRGNTDAINARLTLIGTERAKIEKAYDAKLKNMDDHRKYLKLKVDVNKLDMQTQDYEAYLQYEDLGTSLGACEALIKRYDEFMVKVNAQEDKYKCLVDSASHLRQQKHFASDDMEKLVADCVAKRKRLLTKAAERKAKLLQSKEYHELKNDCDDFESWMAERKRMIAGIEMTTTGTVDQLPPYSANHIDKKINKYDALEKELNANRPRLDQLRDQGLGELCAKRKNFASTEIKQMLQKLGTNWTRLEDELKLKGKELVEARQRKELNNILSGVDKRMNNLESTLMAGDVPNDLRSAKDMHKKYQDFDRQMTVEADLVRDMFDKNGKLLLSVGDNRKELERAISQFLSRFDKLRPILEAKKHETHKNLDLQQFMFDVDEELKWISDNQAQMKNMASVQAHSLFEADKLCKKHTDLERTINNHKANIVKYNVYGTALAKEPMLAMASNDIKTKLTTLNDQWQTLLSQAADRQRQLKSQFDAQTCIEDLNKVHAWIFEKRVIIDDKTDYTVDEELSKKRLAKLDELQHDLSGYRSTLVNDNKLNEQSTRGAAIQMKFDDIVRQLNDMESSIGDRRVAIELALNTHEFQREAADLHKLIQDKCMQAQSEEYGQDYEHLLLIKERFNVLNEEVRSIDARLARLKQLGNDLLGRKVTGHDAKHIRTRCDDIRAAYAHLLTEMQQRASILNAAGEIHQFRKDVYDLRQRCFEKEAALPNDLGKDYMSCKDLMRKQELFADELGAMQPELDEIEQRSGHLRNKYPGDTADNVQAETIELIEVYKDVCAKANKRTNDLITSSQYYAFLVHIKDVGTWLADTKRAIQLRPHCMDLFSVKETRADHDRIKSEIGQRDDMLKIVYDMAVNADKLSHPRAKEIQMHADRVLDEREELIRMWTSKNQVLATLHDCHCIYRDAGQLLNVLKAEEAYLRNALVVDAKLGACDELETALKSHENYAKKIDKHQERVVDLQKSVRGVHDETRKCDELMDAVVARNGLVLDLMRARTVQLKDALVLARFKRDSNELVVWIDERLRFSKSLGTKSVTNTANLSLTEKVKLFQRQKAFEAEINANRSRYYDLFKRGDELINAANKTVSQTTKTAAKAYTDELNVKWYRLEDELRAKAKELEEAKDILEFNDEIDQIDQWLKKKELLVSSSDTGRDFEHCVQLIRKADETNSDVNEERLKRLFAMGDRLVKLGRTERAVVYEHRDGLLKRLQTVKVGLSEYRMKLNGALELHAFNRDLDDVKERINEKANVLGVDLLDNSRNTLDAVQVAQSKVADIEQDLKAIQDKLWHLDHEVAARIVKLYPNVLNDINTKMEQAGKLWDSLMHILDVRKQKIEAAYDYQSFLAEYRDLRAWITDMQNRMEMKTTELPASINDTETALNLHQERRTEIDGKSHRFVTLRLTSHKQKPENRADVVKHLNDLNDQQERLERAWHQKHIELKQTCEFFAFRENLKQLDMWLKTVDKQLRSDDCGDSLQAVESLINRHDNLEQSIKTQNEAFQVLDNTGSEMIRQKYKHNEQVQRLLIELEHKRKEVESLCVQRRRKLDESCQFQQFLINYYSTLHWIKEKLAATIDKTYMDLLNLQMKIQRHQIFSAEIRKTGTKRMDDVRREADMLLARHHSKSAELGEFIKDMDSEWSALQVATDVKKKHLDDAYRFVLFSRLCDDLSTWVAEVEAQLSTEDNGRDLSSCKTLLIRHEALSREIKLNEPKIKEILNFVANNKDNFMVSKFDLLAKNVINSYNALIEPCNIRFDNLQESLALFTLLHDVDDLNRWIHDKLPLALVDDLGTNFDETKLLHKKHLNLEQDLQANQPLVENALKTGNFYTYNK